MSYFVTTRENLPLVLTRRARMLGLPASITDSVIKDFCRWCNCSGSDWAVARMKTIKQIILNTAAGQPGIPKDSWVRHSGDKLKGVYRWLQIRACSSDKLLHKVLCLMNLYTVVTRIETTDADIQKFRHTVETPGPEVDPILCRGIIAAARRVGRTYGSKRPIEYAPLYEQSAYSKDHQEEEFLDVVERSFRTPLGIRIISNYPCVFTPMINVMGFRGYRYTDAPQVMGRVFRIPVGGLKSRWVCDFNKAFDYCIKPMGKWLYNLVAQLPWDITYDESKCYRAVQDRLKKGLRAYSFDLSSATDRFPWILQYHMLKNINRDPKFQEMVALYDDLIKQPALMPDGSTVTWVQGQPLGAYPSFATFTLTHGLLLYVLAGGHYHDQFYVHGDDLIVLDDQLAKDYSAVMAQLGVEISKFKTLDSSSIAEINSKYLTGSHILNVPKWKPITRQNALAQIENWGLDVIKFLKLNASEAQALKRFASLPKSLGGSGINPDGLPLEVRMEGLEDILFKDKELSYEGSARSKVRKRYLRSPNFLNLFGNALRAADTADQADLRTGITPIKIFGDSRDLDLMGKNSYSVNPDLERPIQTAPQSEPVDQVRQAAKKLSKLSSF